MKDLKTIKQMSRNQIRLWYERGNIYHKSRRHPVQWVFKDVNSFIQYSLDNGLVFDIDQIYRLDSGEIKSLLIFKLLIA